MRLGIAIAAAVVLAGFTAQDAEKALDGEWAGGLTNVSVRIDSAKKRGAVVDGGKLTEGDLIISPINGTAITVAIGANLYVFHVHDGGKTVGFAKAGDTHSITLQRTR